jgi:ribosomal protein L37AE/L43A
MDHKMYRCDICNVEILGRHKYARHMDTTHSGTWPCEKCGTMFKSRAYLQKHTLIMHQKDEDKPHRCEDCGKGFVGSNALKTHKMNVHIKARPYACRYGCGAAYNDSSNRGHHERKKHGGNFTGGNSNVAAADANMQMGIQQQQQSQLS